MATSSSKENPQLLERGNLYFLYRPKVEQASVDALEDVQRFYLVLEPYGRDWFRLITFGKKSLPSIDETNQQGWCFVESVSKEGGDIEEGLRRETYETKTRGDRTQPAARPVGEGVYKIVLTENQTRIVYALELPEEMGPAQQTFNISETGNYIISVKNPDKPTPPGAGFRSAERKADFPKRLQETFKDRRFIPADPVDFLDHIGAELILISTGSESAEDIGVSLNPKDEDESTAEVINNLKMRKSRHPLDPLLKGELK